MWQDMTIEGAPKEHRIHPYIYKLYHVKSVDGGLIYDCINEYISVCSYCSGDGEVECMECEGTGKDCNICEGFRKVDCELCGAIGWYETADSKKRREKEAEEKSRKNEFLKDQYSLEF